MSAYVVDTETTGEEPVPEVIELAISKLEATQHANGVGISVIKRTEARFKPAGRIRFNAMAVHHILPFELEGCQPSVEAKLHIPNDMEYMIGHNVDYDWKALGEPACKRICTLALARRIWPGNDGHSLAAMAYQLASDLLVMRDVLKNAYSAAADIVICAGHVGDAAAGRY